MYNKLQNLKNWSGPPWGRPELVCAQCFNWFVKPYLDQIRKFEFLHTLITDHLILITSGDHLKKKFFFEGGAERAPLRSK